DALLGVVLRLALFPGDLDAVDAAVALVQEREVVDEPVRDRNAARRVGARAVDEQREVELLGLGGGQGRRRENRRRQRRGTCRPEVHDVLLSSASSEEPATAGASLS